MEESDCNMFRIATTLVVWCVLLCGSEATSSQKQVVLTFEYVNGTLVPVVQNSNETATSINTGPLIASVFLVSNHSPCKVQDVGTPKIGTHIMNLQIKILRTTFN